jgi:hypothetical protein
MEPEMIGKADTTVAEIGVRLLDDAYLAWFVAESECERALRGWFEAVGAQRAGAHLSYRAALDREDAAARDLERVWTASVQCQDAIPATAGACHDEC